MPRRRAKPYLTKIDFDVDYSLIARQRRRFIMPDGSPMRQVDLAAMVGVHEQTISRVEAGISRNPSHRLILSIARVLGVPSTSLFAEVTPSA